MPPCPTEEKKALLFCNRTTITRLSFRKIVKGVKKLNIEYFGGAMYRVGVLYTPTAQGGLGKCSPQGFFGVKTL